MKILYWDGYDDMEDVNKSFGFERYTVEAGLVTPCIVFDKTKRRYLLGEYDAGRDACLLIGELSPIDMCEEM